MAQPDRNLLFDPRAKGSPARKLHLYQRFEMQAQRLHRIFQQHHGQALSMDLSGKAARGLTNGCKTFAAVY